MMLYWTSTILFISILHSYLPAGVVAVCSGSTNVCETVLENHTKDLFENERLEIAYQGINIFFKKDNARSVDYKIFHSEDHCSAVYGVTKPYGRDISNDGVSNYWSAARDCCKKFTKGRDLLDPNSQIEVFNMQIDGKQKYIKSKDNPAVVFVPLMPPDFTGNNKMANAASNQCPNLVPQFLSIHLGNWRKTREYISSYVKWYTNWQAEIHVMKAGVLELPLNIATGMSLYAEKGDYGRVRASIPIPEYFVAVLIYPTKNQGYAYITLNNPYLDRQQAQLKADHLCPGGHWTSHVGWDVDDMEKGFSFYCYVDDFFRASELPTHPDSIFQRINDGYRL